MERSIKRLSANHGFSMIEVMVSMILLSASMVGLAALQSNGTKYDHQAYLRSQAVIQTSDMINRMRANEAGVMGGFYTVDPAPETENKDCGDVNDFCTPQELATYDIVRWNELNNTLLPGGTGSITFDAATAAFSVMVSWTEQSNERAIGNGDDPYVNSCDGSDNENLRCYQTEIRL